MLLLPTLVMAVGGPAKINATGSVTDAHALVLRRSHAVQLPCWQQAHWATSCYLGQSWRPPVPEIHVSTFQPCISLCFLACEHGGMLSIAALLLSLSMFSCLACCCRDLSNNTFNGM